MPFIWMPRTPVLVVAIVLSAPALFGVGIYSAVTLVGSWWRNGVRMMAIGLGGWRRLSDRSSVPDSGRVSRAARQSISASLASDGTQRDLGVDGLADYLAAETVVMLARVPTTAAVGMK